MLNIVYYPSLSATRKSETEAPACNCSEEGREEMEESIRSLVKQVFGMTEEDIDRLPPGMEKLVSSRLLDYRVIAEVAEAKYCFAGCKAGDRLVVGPGPTVNAQESTCALCIGVLGPAMERVHLMWDRIAEGLDPSEGWLRHLTCFDPGLEKGGMGSVTFKLYAEKIAQP